MAQRRSDAAMPFDSIAHLRSGAGSAFREWIRLYREVVFLTPFHAFDTMWKCESPLISNWNPNWQGDPKLPNPVNITCVKAMMMMIGGMGPESRDAVRIHYSLSLSFTMS